MQIPEKGQICEICSYKYRLTAFRGSKTDIYEVSYRYGNPVAICIIAYFQALYSRPANMCFFISMGIVC